MKITNEQSKEIYELSKSTSRESTNTVIAKKYGISEGAVRKHIKKWEGAVHEVAKNNEKVNSAVAKSTLDVIAEALLIVSNIKSEIRDARNFGGDPARMGSLYAQWIKALELASEILGKIDRSPVVNNIQITKQFNEFIQVVLAEVDNETRARISAKVELHV